MPQPLLVNLSRVTVREYLFGTSPLLMPLIGLLKLLGVRLVASTDNPAVDTLASFAVAEAELPEDVQAALAEDLRYLRRNRFDLEVFHVVPVPHQGTTIYRATLADGSGVVARLQRRVWNLQGRTRVFDTRQFETEFPDGGRLVTFAGTPDMLAPPASDVARRKPCPIAELEGEHRQRLAGRPATQRRVLRDAADLLDYVDRQHAELVRFHVGRGVFEPAPKPVSPDAEAPPTDETPDEAAVLGELDLIGRKTASWTSAACGLGLSIAAFAAVYAFNRDPWLLWMLIPMRPCVLFLDELEKGVAGTEASGRSDGGVTERLFGSLLTWLSEHESEVFVVGTTNDVSRLPPELSRAGRFDGVWFLDLPGQK